jgi:hypothetical protein
MGDCRYGLGEIEACTGLPVLGTIPHDHRGVVGLLGAARSRAVERSPLVRAARSVTTRLAELGVDGHRVEGKRVTA